MGKRLPPLTRLLKKQKHASECKKNHCVCGLNDAIEEYLKLLQIQKKFYDNLSEKILAQE